ncbi:LysR family transcriptional regulator [Novispirillum itersonii]|uniref:DNA-binding transcriptional LysR family regulator n=1 Tax=Novispirillum itersonii TaxID=189 RepID=A0A7W9ZIH2_NOVIT|nr:LysR family transcriptional regulator [Novispirillum itersonii]MBB6212108.1 DNA-binding transcriptional LysR family regulator [Novispirillum itersonii]
MNDIKSLDLNLLKALDALLETRSVTRAAERLGLTQPAVSGLLVRLRDVFGDPLFIRSQRGVVPTPRAEALGVPLRQALRDIQSLLTPEAFVPAQAAMTVTVAATDYAQTAVLLPLMLLLRQEAPGIRIAVRPVDPSGLGSQMECGHLDMALITPDLAAETMRQRVLFHEHYVCLMRKGHPVADTPLTVERFCALDHALMSHDGSKFRGVTDVALEGLGLSRRVVAVVPSFLVLIDLVRRSDLVAMVPGRLATGVKDCVMVPPPVPVPGFTKVLTWHERLQADPAQQWLRDKLVGCIQPTPGASQRYS